MADHETQSPPTDNDASKTEKKPRPRRTTRKKSEVPPEATALAAESATSLEQTPNEALVESIPPKKKPRSRTRKPVEASEEELKEAAPKKAARKSRAVQRSAEEAEEAETTQPKPKRATRQSKSKKTAQAAAKEESADETAPLQGELKSEGEKAPNDADVKKDDFEPSCAAEIKEVETQGAQEESDLEETPKEQEAEEEALAPKPKGKRAKSHKKGGHKEAAHEGEDRAADLEEEAQEKEDEAAGQKGHRKMFFSILAGEQIEVALTEGGKLSEYYLDMAHQKKIKGNIYKGIIQNIDINLQAAFVNYGPSKNGFLQMDEIHQEYWLAHHEPTKGNKFPPIQKVIKPGQEVLVQVLKEPMGNKGAFLTTWLSLAGRFLVLTPGQEQIGVSRKVVDEGERARLKELASGIDPGRDIGVIVRTVSEGTTKTTLKNDLQYLKRIWRDIRKKGTEVQAPALIYREPNLIERAVRDYFTNDVSEIWVDNEEVEKTVHDMVNLLFPRKLDIVHLYSDKRQSLWDRFNLRRQIEQVFAREVLLPSGGRLVFDQTEALMAVDVNSGKISCKGNFEAMAFKTNLEAAESIAQQLRLRDVGGQVVIDFIEMRDRKHVDEVEKMLRTTMKMDRARYEIGHMSSFGLLELVRQRTGFSALSNTQEPCPFCFGTGQRRNIEWQSLQIANDLQRQLRNCKQPVCVYETTPELGMYLLNHKREMLQELEHLFGKHLEISIQKSLASKF